jgi:hypothetical protein
MVAQICEHGTLQQGRLTAAVAPDNPEHIPWHHIEGDIA